MKWKLEYFEQEDTTQPAEIFENALDVSYSKLSAKLSRVAGELQSNKGEEIMNRFEQRLQERLKNPKIAAGYWEMDAELKIMHALEAVRKRKHMSQEQLAALMGKKREAISRLLSSDESNPTLGTLVELLTALNLTADITLRQAREGEGAITVAVDLPPSQ